MDRGSPLLRGRHAGERKPFSWMTLRCGGCLREAASFSPDSRRASRAESLIRETVGRVYLRGCAA